MENKKPEEEKNTSFQLKNFMKQKILGLYGINKTKIEDTQSEPEDVVKLMPYDNTKV